MKITKICGGFRIAATSWILDLTWFPNGCKPFGGDTSSYASISGTNENGQHEYGRGWVVTPVPRKPRAELYRIKCKSIVREILEAERLAAKNIRRITDVSLANPLMSDIERITRKAS